MTGEFKVLESIQSSINGLVVVEEGAGLTRRLTVAGITQSGGVVGKVWQEPLELVKSNKPKVDKCLILGLGTGTIAKNVYGLWPDVLVTGVEIDPVIVGMGQKYFGLNELNIKVVIDDANSFTKKSKEKYDLVLFDVYVGNRVPKIFNSNTYIKSLKRLLKSKGIIAFNRLFTRGYTQDSKSFIKCCKVALTRLFLFLVKPMLFLFAVCLETYVFR